MKCRFVLLLIFLSCAPRSTIIYEEETKCLSLSSPMTDILKIENEEYTCYQSQDVRTFLSHYLILGYGVGLNDIEDSKRKYREYLDNIGYLFEYGLITGEMFLTALKKADYPEVQGILSVTKAELEAKKSFHEALYQYDGKLVKIIYLVKTEEDTTSNRVKYLLHITPFKYEDGGGVVSVFSLEVEKPLNNKLLNPKSLADSSRVVCLKYLGEEL